MKGPEGVDVSRGGHTGYRASMTHMMSSSAVNGSTDEGGDANMSIEPAKRAFTELVTVIEDLRH